MHQKGLRMQIVSVNVGLPREVFWKGNPVRTGIFKDPVDGQVTVGKLNLAGDQQADLTVHGGAHKAVYGYPAEHYDYWRRELSHVRLSWANFGENLTTEGLSEEILCIGDRLRIGSALLMVTQPRMPCYKLAIRFDREDMVQRFLASGRSGFYFSVLEEGELGAGCEISFVSRDANRVTVRDVVKLYLGQERDPELLGRAIDVPALPKGWKSELAARLQGRRP
jgi:MOSC domain-containing protein YiiM